MRELSENDQLQRERRDFVSAPKVRIRDDQHFTSAGGGGAGPGKEHPKSRETSGVEAGVEERVVDEGTGAEAQQT